MMLILLFVDNFQEENVIVNGTMQQQVVQGFNGYDINNSIESNNLRSMWVLCFIQILTVLATYNTRQLR
jgi:hypothetical protein